MRTSEQPRVLIVDDERQNLTILHDLLKNDYQIKVAINGKQALCRASSFPRPDIILLDIVMPEMDGYQVCKKLRNDPNTANIPVIFISAKNAKADVITGLKAGGRDFISKPIDPDAVRERVSQLLKHAPAKLKHEPVNAKPKRPITEMLDETKTESPPPAEKQFFNQLQADLAAQGLLDTPDAVSTKESVNEPAFTDPGEDPALTNSMSKKSHTRAGKRAKPITTYKAPVLNLDGSEHKANFVKPKEGIATRTPTATKSATATTSSAATTPTAVASTWTLSLPVTLSLMGLIVAIAVGTAGAVYSYYQKTDHQSSQPPSASAETIKRGPSSSSGVSTAKAGNTIQRRSTSVKRQASTIKRSAPSNTASQKKERNRSIADGVSMRADQQQINHPSLREQSSDTPPLGASQSVETTASSRGRDSEAVREGATPQKHSPNQGTNREHPSTVPATANLTEKVEAFRGSISVRIESEDDSREEQGNSGTSGAQNSRPQAVRAAPQKSSSTTANPLQRVAASSSGRKTDQVSKQWSVNLNSVRTLKEAQALVQRYQKLGLDAVHTTTQIEKRTWYRVRIENLESHESASQFAKNLERNLGLGNGWVSRQ